MKVPEENVIRWHIRLRHRDWRSFAKCNPGGRLRRRRLPQRPVLFQPGYATVVAGETGSRSGSSLRRRRCSSFCRRLLR